MTKRIFLFLCAGLLAGCASLQQRWASVDPKVKAEQQKEMQAAQGLLDSQQAPEAEEAFTDFQTKYPVSIYSQAAQIGKAKAMELQGKWSEAAALYRATVEATREAQPDIAAQALYEISFCYENLGDEAGLIASLQDALRMKAHLRPEWSMAEIPARLAASYNRVGRLEEAQKYFKQADQGMAQLQAMHDKDAKPEWIARVYYEMGLYSTNQLAFENLQASLDTMKMVQIFSLRSVEAQGAPWSQLASDGLQANYRDIWNTIQDIPMNKSMDVGAAEREKLERQTDFIGQLLAMINDLKRFETPEVAEKNPVMKELLSFLNNVESQGSKFMSSSRLQTRMTPESQRRNALKKEGVMIKSVDAKEEKKQSAPSPQPGEVPQKPVSVDPNL
jgi:tetratricopeptide (TPR) repeat protein